MIVQKFSQPSQFLSFNRSFRREPLLEILHGGANLRVIRQHAHDLCVPVEPHMPRIRRQ